MAVETEILRLLFSLSGIRSIYSTFMQGPERARSLLELERKLGGLFPLANQLDVNRVSSAVWQASNFAQVLGDQVYNIQRIVGAGWPSQVISGQAAGANDLVSFSGSPSIPSLVIPGAPSARFIVTGLITAEVVAPDGIVTTHTVQVVGAYTTQPTWSELVADLLDQATVIIEMGTDTYPGTGTIVIDTATLQQQVSLEFILQVQTTIDI